MDLSIDNLLPHQVDIFRSPARFKVLAAGRRWGKTKLGIALAFAAAWAGGRVWWTSPNYPIGRIAWREISFKSKMIGAHVRQADRLVEFPGGGYLQLKSADNPDSLRGEGLDRVILDEAAFLAESAWTEALRAALSDRGGDAVFLSTPNGRNYFHRLHLGAGDKDEWQAWQYPTADNPHIPPAEIALARAELAARVFAQEFEARFLDIEGAVFRDVRARATARPQDRATEGHDYIFGIDWARQDDFTVVLVLDLTTTESVLCDAWTGLRYEVQIARVKGICERFAPLAVVSETNNMGDVLTERLQAEDIPIVPFTSTNASKMALVDSLVLSLERQAITLLPDEKLIQELEAYQATRLPSGLTRYACPEGVHDDRVMALMLANWGASNASIDMTARLM